MTNKDSAVMKIVGVGSAGGNILGFLMKSKAYDAEFIASNTDSQVLEISGAPTKILLGMDIKNGVVEDSFPGSACVSVQGAIRDISASIEGADIVFLIAGMGGSATHAIQLFAEVARSLGIFTIAIITLPFSHEGEYRMARAEDGINSLGKLVNSLVVLPNDQICVSVEKDCLDAFRAGDVVINGVLRGIIEQLTK